MRGVPIQLELLGRPGEGEHLLAAADKVNRPSGQHGGEHLAHAAGVGAGQDAIGVDRPVTGQDHRRVDRLQPTEPHRRVELLEDPVGDIGHRGTEPERLGQEACVLGLDLGEGILGAGEAIDLLRRVAYPNGLCVLAFDNGPHHGGDVLRLVDHQVLGRNPHPVELCQFEVDAVIEPK